MQDFNSSIDIQFILLLLSFIQVQSHSLHIQTLCPLSGNKEKKKRSQLNLLSSRLVLLAESMLQFRLQLDVKFTTAIANNLTPNEHVCVPECVYVCVLCI